MFAVAVCAHAGRVALPVRLGALLVAALCGVILVLAEAPARAAAGDGGGQPICYHGVCTIGVGVPGDPGSSSSPSPGDPGGPGSPDPAVCSNTDPMSGCDPCPLNGTAPADPAACDAFSQNLFCSELNPAGTNTTAAQWEAFLQDVGCGGNQYVPPNPAVLAVQAAGELSFGQPSIDRSPSASLRYDGYALTYANLATWFWTSGASWQVQVSPKVTAANEVATAWATATARPTALVFDPGDGDTPVSCAGPGLAWTAGDTNGPSPSGCSYTYTQATTGPVTVTVSIRWQITWTGSEGMGGTLPVQVTSASQQLQVLQVDSVNR